MEVSGRHESEVLTDGRVGHLALIEQIMGIICSIVNAPAGQSPGVNSAGELSATSDCEPAASVQNTVTVRVVGVDIRVVVVAVALTG